MWPKTVGEESAKTNMHQRQISNLEGQLTNVVHWMYRWISKKKIKKRKGMNICQITREYPNYCVIPFRLRLPSMASFLSWQLWHRKGPCQPCSFSCCSGLACSEIPCPDFNRTRQTAQLERAKIFSSAYPVVSLHVMSIYQNICWLQNQGLYLETS